MSEIIKLKNPFRRNERRIISVVDGQTIYDIRRHPDIVKDLDLDVDVDISINGQIIPEEKWLTRKVKQNEFLFILPKVAGDGDGKTVLNVVLMIAVMYYAPGAANLLWGGTSTIAIGGAGIYLTSVAIMVGGAMVISALTPHPKLPSSGFIDSEQSQVFGWNPATIQRQGVSVPRFYGLNKLYGNVVACHTEKEAVTYEETTITETYYYGSGRGGYRRRYRDVTIVTEFDPRKVNLYALFNLGIGPVREPVVSGTLKLNDQLRENFDAVYYDARRGNLRQDAISYFNQTKLEVVVNRLVEYGSPVIYETSNGNFNDLEIELSFPGGLYDGSGADLANNTVNVTVEVKKTTASVWIKLVDNVALTDNVGNKVIQNYPTTGVITIDYGSNYQIRITKETAEEDNIRYGDHLYLDKVREVIDIAFTHPRRALVGIKALATNQLSGSIRFSCYSRGLYIVDITDSASPIIYSNNPALVIYDILTQPVFSGEHSPWLDLCLMLNFNGADGTTSTVDDSERGHTISFTGTAELDTAEKRFGTASLLLDGDSDDVNIANDRYSFDILENIYNDCTVDFFVRFADHVGYEFLVTHYEDDDNRWYIAHEHDAGLYFGNQIAGVVKVSLIGTKIDDTNWHHVALCKDGANIGLYLDGTQIAHDLMVSSDADTYDGSLFIGQEGDGGSWFQGHIDHLRIIKQNIFNAAPNATPDDTIVVPTGEYTDPGNSYAVERYDGYNPSKLNDADFEDLADWCDDAKINPVNFGIASISQAVNAVITTTSEHNLKIGSMVLFRGVSSSGMTELVDGIMAMVLKVTDNTHFTIDLDTSAYTAYNLDRILHNFEILTTVHRAWDESTYGHDAADAEFEGSSKLDTAQYKFGASSLKVAKATNSNVQFSKSSAFPMFSNLTDDWTISLFWRADAAAANTDCIFMVEQDSVNLDLFVLEYDWTAGDLEFSNIIDGTGKVIMDVAYAMNKEQWYHIAIVKKGDKFGLYVDGVQIDFDTMIAGDIFDYNDAWLMLGAYLSAAAYYADGHIDSFYITNRDYFNVTPDVGLTSAITVPIAAHVSIIGTVEEYKPRFAFNGGFDTESNMWDAALRVCELCRCIPYWNGDKIYIAIDKSANPVYAFTMGNILRDSYSEVWIPKAERASEIEIHYRNAQKDYARQPFLLINPDAGNVTKKMRLDLFGITDIDMANRIAEHRLLQNQHIRKLAKWSSDIEAIPCVIGDVVDVQHDVTNYGEMGSGDDDITGGGRVIAATNVGDAVITIDGKVEFDDADWESPGLTEYKLLVKTADDATPESRTIIDCVESSVNGGTFDITVDGLFIATPAAGDVWAIGVAEYETKEYRIVNLRQNNEQKVEITAIEYIEEVYAND